MTRQARTAVGLAAGLAVAVAVLPGCGNKSEPTTDPGAGGGGGSAERMKAMMGGGPGGPGGYSDKMKGAGGPAPPGGAGDPGSAAAPADPDLPTPPPAGRVQFPAGSVRVAAARLASENNLKQIMLAMHQFHDAHQFFPVGLYDASGAKPGLGWRVAILPFLGEDALYRQFKLDQAWDSEANKKLIRQMPKVFGVAGSDLADGLTYYRAVVGPGAALTPPPAGTPGAPAPGGRMVAISDGTANTAVIAEAAEPAVWTRPDRLAFGPDEPLPKFGGLFGDRFFVGMADGSVRPIPKSTDEKVIRALFSARGGEVFEMPGPN
ncbi:MAG: DUF1559 domain-containing protein [Gemmataceae bacterium]|nr:DUF1559 domain-containing protein [Gemmataceae bacterium]